MEAHKVIFDQMYSVAQTVLMLPSLVRLGIAKQLALSPKSSVELCENTSMKPERLHRVLNLFEISGFFTYDTSTHKWSNNYLSESLTDDNFADCIYATFSQLLINPYFLMDKVISSNKTGLELAGLHPVFEEMEKDIELHSQFQNMMKIVTKRNLPHVLNGIDLTDSKRILDVGGGDGTLVSGLAEKYQDKIFGVFERTETLEIAKKNIEKTNFADRIEVCSGNFFEAITEGFDTIVMKHILHDWDDEPAGIILKNCRKALNLGDRLIVIDAVLEKGDHSYLRSVSLDVHIMAIFGGKERTREEFEELLNPAGFKIEKEVSAFFNKILTCVAV